MGSVTGEFYSLQALVEQPWFVVKSTITLKKLIENGEIEAVDVSTNPSYKRYKISRKAAEDFMERRKNKSN